MPFNPLESWLLILTGSVLLVSLIIEIAQNERGKDND